MCIPLLGAAAYTVEQATTGSTDPSQMRARASAGEATGGHGMHSAGSQWHIGRATLLRAHRAAPSGPPTASPTTSEHMAQDTADLGSFREVATGPAGQSQQMEQPASEDEGQQQQQPVDGGPAFSQRNSIAMRVAARHRASAGGSSGAGRGAAKRHKVKAGEGWHLLTLLILQTT